MNKAMLTVGIILLGIISLVMINVLSNYSTGSELDYYLLKETTEAAMVDSIDTTFYRNNGLLRMDKEKFAESFLCRFADSVDNTREYTVGFYGMNEVPPKVTVKIDSNTAVSIKGEAAKITTSIDAILEDDYTTNDYISRELSKRGVIVGSKKVKLDSNNNQLSGDQIISGKFKLTDTN